MTVSGRFAAEYCHFLQSFNNRKNDYSQLDAKCRDEVEQANGSSTERELKLLPSSQTKNSNSFERRKYFLKNQKLIIHPHPPIPQGPNNEVVQFVFASVFCAASVVCVPTSTRLPQIAFPCCFFNLLSFRIDVSLSMTVDFVGIR